MFHMGRNSGEKLKGKLEELKKKHEREVVRIRRRDAGIFYFAFAAFALAIVASAGMGQIELRSSISGFHSLCDSMPEGASLESAHEFANEQKLFFGVDEDLSRHAPYPVYALKPEKSWPAHLGCLYYAREARLYRKIR